MFLGWMIDILNSHFPSVEFARTALTRALTENQKLKEQLEEERLKLCDTEL